MPIAVPFSALETVGFDTMTGLTPGAFVIASKCTNPIRPIPITPTLTSSFISVSTDIDKAEDCRVGIFINPNDDGVGRCCCNENDHTTKASWRWKLVLTTARRSEVRNFIAACRFSSVLDENYAKQKQT